MSEIVVIGSINTDLVFTCDRIPIAGETLSGNEFLMIPGGKGANQAVAAARLGADVTMIGAVGRDANGKAMIDNLKRQKVNTDAIKVVDHITGVAGIMVDHEDNSIVVIPGANEDVDIALIEDVKDLVLKAKLVVLQLEIALETVAYVIDFCYQNGIQTILNPAPSRKLPKALIDKVTYITPNEIEVNEIIDNMGLEAVLHEYPNKMIVTRGEKGIDYHDGQRLVNVPSVRVKPVDTTGAGDTFNGAFATRIVKGDTLEEAIHFAAKAAAISVTKQGAQGGMPTVNEIERWQNHES